MIVPSGWRVAELGGIVRIATGQVSPTESPYSGLLHVGPENLRTAGGIMGEGLRPASELGLISGKYAFDRKAILYSKIRPNLNKVGLPEFDGICSADMYPIWVRDPEILSREYLYCVMTSEIFLDKATSRSFRTGIPKINREDLLSISIQIPSIAEQQKIAAILHTWDEARDGVERIHREKSAQLKSFRASIFDPRFGLAAEWATIPLRSVSKRVTSKSKGSPHLVMTISAKTGFVSQASKYSRDMAGANVVNYTLLHRGEFAYNKGNSLTYPQGCIYQLQEKSALVPNIYYSFKLAEKLNSSFYAHHFAAGGLNRQLAQRISSGVRGNGLLNLSPTDFFEVQVPVPDRVTQDSVANLLDTASRELALLDQELAFLRTQKQGLMQKLLTGDVRVNVELDQDSGRDQQ